MKQCIETVERIHADRRDIRFIRAVHVCEVLGIDGLTSDRPWLFRPSRGHWLLMFIHKENAYSYMHEGDHVEATHEQVAQIVEAGGLHGHGFEDDEQLQMFDFKRRGGARPGAGRPLDGDEPKSIKVQFRITQGQLDKLTECLGEDINRNQWAYEQFSDALDHLIDNFWAHKRIIDK